MSFPVTGSVPVLKYSQDGEIDPTWPAMGMAVQLGDGIGG